MKVPVTLIILTTLTIFTSSLPGIGADGKAAQAKHAYVMPYGLTVADVGAIKVPNFLAAVLGKGTEVEQEAALAVFTKGQQEGFEELKRISGTFKG